MGLLDRLFKKDPADLLQRAEDQLAKGDPRRALDALRSLSDPPSALAARASELTRSCRRQLVDKALEKARMAEEAGYLDDAADWLSAALEDAGDEPLADEVRTAAQALAQRRQQAEERAAEAAVEPPPPPPPEAEEMTDDESLYLSLVGMLQEELAERYWDRPESFKGAFLAINHGRPEDALAPLDELATADAKDPVLRLERGRARLLTGDATGARDDFDHAWQQLGEGTLDLQETVSLPGLWAEAQLAVGDPEPVLERLVELGEPEHGNAELSQRYGDALLMAERWEEAGEFLLAATNRLPGIPTFPFQLAQVLRRLERRPLAIDCLETAIAPSCASGNCAKPPLHGASVRLLLALYLEDDQSLKRVQQLIELLRQNLRGRFTAGDQRLLALFHERSGDPVSAAQATAEAERLESMAQEEVEAAPDLMAQQQQAAL